MCTEIFKIGFSSVRSLRKEKVLSYPGYFAILQFFHMESFFKDELHITQWHSTMAWLSIVLQDILSPEGRHQP